VSGAERLSIDGYDEVWRVDCAGAAAFVALHAVLSGHAFGGIRIRPYPSEAAALGDALALARAMSRKVVLAGIAGGGGKSVLVEPGPGVDRAACVEALGRFVESLEGRYGCGPDLGFTAADDAALRRGTGHVACSGMSEATATSVHAGMRAALGGEPASVAIQGVGAVGRPLAEALRSAGARVVVHDVRPVDGFENVGADEIHELPVDVFAPCAAGGALDARTIPRLRCRLVCGGANNPFATDDDVERLHGRGIEYVPDVLANAGATIVGASTSLGEADRVAPRMAALERTMEQVLARARAEGRSAHHVAVEMADERIAARR